MNLICLLFGHRENLTAKGWCSRCWTWSDYKKRRKKEDLPKFVRLGKKGTALRLTTSKSMYSDKLVYYRDGGAWSTEFRIERKTGKIFTVIPHVKHIHDKELIPTTEEDWAEDNGEYAYN